MVPKPVGPNKCLVRKEETSHGTQARAKEADRPGCESQHFLSLWSETSYTEPLCASVSLPVK